MRGTLVLRSTTIDVTPMDVDNSTGPRNGHTQLVTTPFENADALRYRSHRCRRPRHRLSLTHPTSGSPLSPLDISQVAALNDLIRLFTATLPNTNVVHPLVDHRDTTTPTPINVMSPDAPRLRVEHEPQGDKDETVTYRTVTKRKSRKKPTASAAPMLLRPPSFIPPGTSPAPTSGHPPVACAPHQDNPDVNSIQRSRHRRRKPKHLAAATCSVPATPTTELDILYDDHWALHGTAKNLDTGQPAEYAELSTCSEGAQWIHSNA
jgi:hypothetical protein